MALSGQAAWHCWDSMLQEALTRTTRRQWDLQLAAADRDRRADRTNDELIARVRAKPVCQSGQYRSRPAQSGHGCAAAGDAFELADLTPTTPTIGNHSTTYADLHTQPIFDAEHWATNMRNPVRFQAIVGSGRRLTTLHRDQRTPMLTQAIIP